MDSNLGKLNGPHVEIFRQTSAERQDRIKFQNKCVEMSIQVTSGLAAAFAALMVASINKNGMPIVLDDLAKVVGEPLIVVVLYFYVLIQLLLLTNYIYHTVGVLGFDHVYHQELTESARTFHTSKDRMWWTTRLGGFLVNSAFQPLIFYACIVIALWCLWTCLSPYRRVFFDVELIWLIVLGIVHLFAKRLCKYFLNDYLDEKS